MVEVGFGRVWLGALFMCGEYGLLLNCVKGTFREGRERYVDCGRDAVETKSSPTLDEAGLFYVVS